MDGNIQRNNKNDKTACYGSINVPVGSRPPTSVCRAVSLYQQSLHKFIPRVCVCARASLFLNHISDGALFGQSEVSTIYAISDICTQRMSLPYIRKFKPFAVCTIVSNFHLFPSLGLYRPTPIWKSGCLDVAVRREMLDYHAQKIYIKDPTSLLIIPASFREKRFSTF